MKRLRTGSGRRSWGARLRLDGRALARRGRGQGCVLSLFASRIQKPADIVDLSVQRSDGTFIAFSLSRTLGVFQCEHGPSLSVATRADESVNIRSKIASWTSGCSSSIRNAQRVWAIGMSAFTAAILTAGSVSWDMNPYNSRFGFSYPGSSLRFRICSIEASFADRARSSSAKPDAFRGIRSQPRIFIFVSRPWELSCAFVACDGCARLPPAGRATPCMRRSDAWLADGFSRGVRLQFS